MGTSTALLSNNRQRSDRAGRCLPADSSRAAGQSSGEQDVGFSFEQCYRLSRVLAGPYCTMMLADLGATVLIADEVQSGFGRTGRWFAFEHFGVVPDIMVMAKGLASGFPLSGIASRRELMEKWVPGTHGGTYGGNAVACAAAAATIQVMREEGLIENSARQGAFLLERLREIQK